MKKLFFGWTAIFAVAICWQSTSPLHAQDPFTWTGATNNNWTVPGNWDDTNNFTFYPGQRAGDATPILNDIANVGIASTAISINTGETITIGVLNITANDVSIVGDGAFRPGAINIGTSTGVSIDTAMGGANVTIGMDAANSINLNGTFTSTGQTIRADSGTVNFNGAIIADSGTTTLRQNSDASAVFNFNTGISGAGNVLYAGRGTFNHLVDNTYTGSTTLGSNSPNQSGIHVISTDGAFSTGRITFTGGANPQFIRGDGTGARTLANDIQISRDAGFDGTDQITLTGDVFQGNSRSIINNISGATLNVTGRLFAANSNDGRVLAFSGSGTTIISGPMYDRYDSALADQIGELTPQTNRFGALGNRGTGRVILDSGFQANYTGWTEVRDGTIQLGVGGAAVNLNGNTIAGAAPSAGTVGTLEVNQNTSVSLGTLNGALNINSIGGGDVVLSGPNFGTGTITSRDGGTVFINGGEFAASSRVAIRPASSQMAVNDASGLMVGQSVLVSGTNSSGNAFSHELFITDIYDNGSGTFNVDLSGNVSSSGDGLYTLDADAGTGTGLRNAIANGGTIAGTGIIGGNLTVAPTTGSAVAPGASIGTLTVNGNANVLGTIEIEFDAAASQTIDLLAIGGDLNLGAASVLDLQNIGAALTDSSYVFATYGGTLTGTFATINGLQSGYTVDYAFGGNSIALVAAVPEPSTLLLALPLTLAGAMRRRRV